MPRKDPLQAQRDLMRRIQTEGLPAAFDALMAVCKDPKAPAPAKATAGTTIFRAGGVFDKDAHKGSNKPVEDMTAEEIATRLAELRAQQAEFLERADDADEDGDDEDELKDVFG